MRDIGALVLLAALTLVVCGCEGGGSTSVSSGSQPAVNPTPAIAAISPTSSPVEALLLRCVLTRKLSLLRFIGESTMRTLTQTAETNRHMRQMLSLDRDSRRRAL
jgi:hypothetical protein